MRNDALVIDDLVILGRSSPDRLSDNRVSVCAAGYSRTVGFVRLYPTRMDSPLKVWNVVTVPVERNTQDSRAESWKIHGSKSEWEHLSDKIEVVGELRGKDRQPLLNPIVSKCVKDLEDQGRSLGIVMPSSRKCYFKPRDDYDSAIQMTLYGGSSIPDKQRYRLQPRAMYRCQECRLARGHDQQILEWGVYEWMRKNPGNEEQVWENLFSKEKQQEILFLVGNQARRPHSFMVISILRIPRIKDP